MNCSVPQPCSPSNNSPETFEKYCYRGYEKGHRLPKEGISTLCSMLSGQLFIASQGSVACASSINSYMNNNNVIQEAVEAAIEKQTDKITTNRLTIGFFSSIYVMHL